MIITDMFETAFRCVHEIYFGVKDSKNECILDTP